MADREIVLRLVADTIQAESNLRVVEDQIKRLTRELSAGTISVEKYDKEMRDLSRGAAELKGEISKLDAETKKHTATQDKAAASSDKLIGMIQRWAGPAVIGLAIKQTIAWADNLSDLADQTDISISSLQRLERAASANGKSLETVTDAVFQLSKRLGDGDKSAVAAVKALGFSLDDIMKMDPVDRFQKLGQAVLTIEDKAKQAALGTDLLGRSFKENVGVLKELNSGLSAIPVASEASIKALGGLSDAFGRATIAGKALLAEVLGQFAQGKAGFFGGSAGFGAGQNFGQQLIKNWIGMPSLPSGPGVATNGGVAAPGLPDDLAKILTQPITGAGGGKGQVVAVPNGRGGVTYRPMTEADRQAYMATLPLLTGFMGSAGTPEGGISSLLPSVPLPGGGMALLASGLTSGFSSGTSPGFFSRLGGTMLGGLPQTVMAALTGGGALGGTLGGLAGGALGTVLGTGSGALAGSAFGSILPGIGTVLGGLGGSLLGKLFGPSQNAVLDQNATGQIDTYKAQLLSTYGSLDAIRQLGDIVGVSLADAFGSKSRAGLEHFSQLMTEFQAKQDRLQSALTKYGLTWEDLGVKAKEFFFLQDAQGLLEDFKLLELAGVDTTKLLEKMNGSFNALVQTAITNGLTIPNAMRPMLDQLMQMGLLLDAAGAKIENIDSLFANITPPDPIVIDVEYKYPGAVDPNPDGLPESSAYMNGGPVTWKGIAYAARGGFMRGTDAVLAALTPGEFVMNRESVRRIGRQNLESMNRGGSAGRSGTVINIDARDSVFDGVSLRTLADRVGEAVMMQRRAQGLVG